MYIAVGVLCWRGITDRSVHTMLLTESTLASYLSQTVAGGQPARLYGLLEESFMSMAMWSADSRTTGRIRYSSGPRLSESDFSVFYRRSNRTILTVKFFTQNVSNLTLRESFILWLISGLF